MGYLKSNARNWLRWDSYLRVYHILNESRFRLITSPLRGLPDFVILGAMKSGTTSLYDFVVKHPGIAPAAKKEVQYFSTRHRYRLGRLWYRSNFPTSLSRRRFYKKTNQRLLSGEATPAYLFYPMVPGRMKEILPDVKLIVILRNPVDRAYSHYHHSLRKNMEPMSFEKAIKSEEKWRAEESERLVKDPNFILTGYRTLFPNYFQSRLVAPKSGQTRQAN